jgi:hypothetical protein
MTATPWERPDDPLEALHRGSTLMIRWKLYTVGAP